MKTAVEELSPTRVRLSVEVSFEELKPSLDKAYREVSKQVRIPGFRPGRVPPRVIDMRIGRGAVLTEAVNDALPEFYGKAVEETEVRPLGQPEVDIKQLDDGKDLEFTAEVEVRPKLELPDLSTLAVTVDSANVTDEDVDEYLTGLRERFASLKTADRAAEDGDYVSIDLSATVDGEQVEDAQASGLSYKIGSEALIDGLDEALLGLSAGESKTFTTELSGGAKAGEEAEVTVTVQSVKIQELPELDDDFAQLASEFDTLEELREDTRKNLRQSKRYQQTNQARERAVEALIEALDIPLPEAFTEHELGHARETVQNQLVRLQMTMEQYLEAQEQTAEEFETELRNEAEKGVRTGIALDELASAEEISVSQAELSYFVADQAQRMGVPPQQLAQQLSEAGQIGVAMTEVARGKAAASLAEKVKVTDSDGNEIDVKALVEELNSEVEAAMAAQMAQVQAAQSAQAGDAEAEAEAEEDADAEAAPAEAAAPDDAEDSASEGAEA
ncbi:MAG: trigger factor [Candidatus Dormibacteraeota bacterium]|nr:trigger factor [Candidatus Dormibacteraeota bacterium]